MLKNTADIKKGDVIVATREDINDARSEIKFPAPIHVTEVIEHREDSTTHIKVRQPKGTLISPDRYLRSPVVRVGRAATLAGIKFLKMDNDLYVQADGPWTVEADFIPYECDGPHPVKLTPKKARMILSERHLWPWDVVDAAEAVQNGFRNPDTGKLIKGYQCRGFEEHAEKQWCVHRQDEDNFDHKGMWCNTPTEAAELIQEGFYS